MLLLKGRISPSPSPPPNMTLCVIDRLGSKGVVVKCTAAIFLFFQPLLYLAPLHMSPVDRDGQVSEISPYL